jgi:hypothetical protein
MPAIITERHHILHEIRQQLHDLNANVKIARAETANTRIRLSNRFLLPEKGLSAVQKTVCFICGSRFIFY